MGIAQSLELHIAELVLEMPGLSSASESLARQALQDALRRLAERLERSPLSQSARGTHLRIEALRVSAPTLEALGSGRGADELADALYAQILRRME